MPPCARSSRQPSRGGDPCASWSASIHDGGWQVSQDGCCPVATTGAGRDDSGAPRREARRLGWKEEPTQKAACIGCLPSGNPLRGAPPPLTTGATSAMREHETTDLFGSYLGEGRRNPPLKGGARSSSRSPTRHACRADDRW